MNFSCGSTEFYVNYFSEKYENLFLSEISKNSTSIFKDLFLLQIFYPHILVQVLSYLCIQPIDVNAPTLYPQ